MTKYHTLSDVNNQYLSSHSSEAGSQMWELPAMTSSDENSLPSVLIASSLGSHGVVGGGGLWGDGNGGEYASPLLSSLIKSLIPPWGPSLMTLSNIITSQILHVQTASHWGVMASASEFSWETEFSTHQGLHTSKDSTKQTL